MATILYNKINEETVEHRPYGGSAHWEARASEYFKRCNFNNAARLCTDGGFEVIVSYDGHPN